MASLGRGLTNQMLEHPGMGFTRAALERGSAFPGTQVTLARGVEGWIWNDKQRGQKLSPVMNK